MRQLTRFFMVFASLAIAACGGEAHHEDLHIKLKEIRSKPGRPIEPVPKYEPVKQYPYPASAKNRDPFYSILQKRLDAAKDKKDVVGAPNFNRPKQPLEAFPLDALKMVGHLKEDGRMWALMQGPKGMIYRVTMGTYMGKHYGRVYRVTETYIGLIETVKDGKKWKKRKIKVELIKDKVDDK